MDRRVSSPAWSFEVSAFGRLVRGVRLLAGLLLFNGIGAVGGGIALMTGNIGLPLRLLDGTPFSDYAIPAWILTLVVGGTSLGAAWLLTRRSAWAGAASMVAGSALLGWIVTEFVLIPEGWMLQLPYFLIGLAVLWFGWRTYRDVDGRA